MKTLESILLSHPDPDKAHAKDYSDAVEALSACAEACTACADACLAETQHLAVLRRCITTNLDCVDVCYATSRLLLRQTNTPNDLVHAQLHACVIACQRCAEECRSHAAAHAHCKICADVCHQCQARCNFLLGEITSSGTAEESNEQDNPSLSV
jgi:hypothetical protein